MKRRTKLNQKEIALHAAGIGAAFHDLQTTADPKTRQKVFDMHGGYIGIMQAAADLAQEVEGWRVRNYPEEHFNDEVLPFYYEVWDEIASVVWQRWAVGRDCDAGDVLNGMMSKGAKQ